MIDVIILAAGQGSRMRSSLPKVLHCLGGISMVKQVINQASSLVDANIHIVVGHGADKVQSSLADENHSYVMQHTQEGTGHAVAQALPSLAADSSVLILYGDVPLTSAATMKNLVEVANEGKFGLLTVSLDDPTGYGRIVRNHSTHAVERIVEHKDACEVERSICEVNTGIMAVPAKYLHRWIPRLSNENVQGEYYLTDIIAMAVEDGIEIITQHPQDHHEVQGVNDRLQLAELERWYQLQQANNLMLSGVTLRDPMRIDVRGEVIVGKDIEVDCNVIFEGKVEIEDKVKIDANCILRNCLIKSGAHIHAFSTVDEAIVGENAQVGPYARLRPGAELHEGSRVGNFVEIKKSVIGSGAKVNHLSYIGDAKVGEKVNIGAGTITCNYDGVNKSTTVIGRDSFIGSNTSLVAPVELGEGVTVGAGSVVTKDVSDHMLTVARGKQQNISGWKRPIKATNKGK